MSLVRAWMRQLSGASGAAVVVPVAVFGSMVLLALAGGFGSLAGLGQALAGPSIPSGARAASAVTAAAGSGGTAPLLAVVSAPAPTLVASVKLPTAAGRGGGSGGSGGRGSGGSNGTGPSSPTTPTPTTPPSSPPPTAPPTGGPPSAPPTLVDGVVSLGTSITSKLPGPIGQLATSTLQNLGHTVDQILPGNAVSHVTGAVGSTVNQLQNGVSQLGSGVSGLLHNVP